MFSVIATAALAFALSGSPAPCDTMGETFQCDKTRAMSDTGVAIWERDFNLTYVTTRLDGVQPVVGPNMVALQDDEFPNMWHVYNTTYMPTLYV